MAEETKRQYNRKKAKSVRDLSFNQMAKDFRTPALMITGMTIANIGIKQLNKILDKPAVNGLLGVDSKTLKKYIAPTASVVTGLAVYQLMPNQDVKVMGLGIATKGGIMALKEISGKDILSGMDGTENVGNALSQANQPPISIEQVKQSGSPLDLPLYEVEDNQSYTAFRKLMDTEPDYGTDGVQGNGTAAYDKEIILNSRLEKDNITDEEPDNDFSTEKSDVDMTITGGEISGEPGVDNIPSVITTVDSEPAYQNSYREEPEETLDLSQIP
jgi:hypothetical protein